MSTEILKIENLSKSYGNKVALDNVNLTIYQGEVLGLLGVNGAGKTTLSSILATLKAPTFGDVLFFGNSIYKNLEDYRKALGYCPQKPNLDEYINVKDNLIFAGRYYGMSYKEAVKRADELLQEFNLVKYADFDIENLSGGYQQRVSIARALVHYPKIVIFDEPTVGLDPDIRRQIWQILKKLKDQGITIILTTHYLEEAEEIADRICILNKGQILLTQSLTELKKAHGKHKLEEIFLELIKIEEHDNGL
ncbi:ABC transporter ATP-binding protein [Candidatus Dependentiae bacterium]|nr:ABC transporter ATP-binding protein [Candidatus Dependentiae bacterium]